MQIAPPTARRAGQLIAVVTVAVALAGGVAMTLLDRDEFPSLGSGMWWSLQTITTVGYGDHVPQDSFGQIVAGVVMVTGIGFISVVTASISAAFVESARRKRGDASNDEVLARLERIERASRSSRRSVRRLRTTEAEHQRVADEHAQTDGDEGVQRVDEVVPASASTRHRPSRARTRTPAS